MIIEFKNRQNYIETLRNKSWGDIINHYRKSIYFIGSYNNTINIAQRNLPDKVYHIWLLKMDIFEFIKDDIKFNKKRIK